VARHLFEELSMKKTQLIVFALACALAAAPLVAEAKGKKHKTATSKSVKKAGKSAFGKPQK
jgi:hypothetical protein